MEAATSSPEIVPSEPGGQQTVKTESEQDRQSPEHRISCHRCGNIRKRRLLCSRKTCPHIFCGRCCDKMKDEYGPDIFVDGCPVCKDMCCCSNKSISCLRINHCYRKCPASKNKAACSAYKEELAHSSLPDNRTPLCIPSDKPNGILDLLAAVADNQLNEQIAAANGKRKYHDVSGSSSSPAAAQKTNVAKTEPDITSNPAFGFEAVAPAPIAFLHMPAATAPAAPRSGESSSQGSTAAPQPQYLTPDLFAHYGGAYAAMMQPGAGGPALALFPAAAAAGFDGLTQRFLTSDFLLAPVIPQLGTTNAGTAATVSTNGSTSGAQGASAAGSGASGGAATAPPPPPALSLFSGAYRPAAPLYVDSAGGSYHLYDMNGIDGFVHARPSTATSAATPAHYHPGFAPIAVPGLQYHPALQGASLSYAFLTRPMLSTTALPQVLNPQANVAPSAAPSAAAAFEATSVAPSAAASHIVTPSVAATTAANTRRIPFAGTEFPPVRMPKVDVTQRPSPPRTSSGSGPAAPSLVLPEGHRSGSELGSAVAAAATVGAAAASLAAGTSGSSGGNSPQNLAGVSADPMNILALVSSYSSTMGSNGSTGSTNK